MVAWHIKLQYIFCLAPYCTKVYGCIDFNKQSCTQYSHHNITQYISICCQTYTAQDFPSFMEFLSLRLCGCWSLLVSYLLARPNAVILRKGMVKISEPAIVLHGFVIIYYLCIRHGFRWCFFRETPIVSCMVWCEPTFWMITGRLLTWTQLLKGLHTDLDMVAVSKKTAVTLWTYLDINMYIMTKKATLGAEEVDVLL